MLNLASLNQRVNYLTGKINSIPNPPLADTLQQVVNAGNGISNFAVGSTATINSTNFTNQRQLLLNADAEPTIKMIDNTNASHFTTFDIDTINLDGTTTTWADIVSGASSSNTLQEVLLAGNTATNLQAIFTGTAGLGNTATSVSPAGLILLDTDGALNTANGSLNTGGLSVSHDDGNVNGIVSGSLTAVLNAGINNPCGVNLSSASAFTSPYPANIGTASITTNNNSGSQVSLGYSAPFANASSVTMDLFGITHTQGTGSPSPNNPFTISTNKDLYLGGANIEVNASSIKFGDVASQFATHTIQGFNAFDNTSSAFAYYRNSQFSLYGTGNASLYANKSSLQFTDTAGTGTANLSSSTLTMISPTTGNSLYNSGSARISSVNSTGASTPIFTLENSTAGANAGVAIETYKNQATAGTAGDEVFRLSMFGKNSGNNKEEYGRITCNIRDPNPSTAGADGSLQLAVPVGDAMTTFLDLNGNSNRVNCLRQLNIQNNDIISSGGDIHLNANASTGTGKVILQPKVGSYIIMNNLPTSVVGLPSGAVWNNLGVLNIAP
jgi:hypothetical protein